MRSITNRQTDKEKAAGAPLPGIDPAVGSAGIGGARRLGVWWLLSALCLFPYLSSNAYCEERLQFDPRAVEAAFLLNFTRYVNWPEGVFDDTHSPWRICVLGADPFGQVLEKTFKGRMEGGRRFTIERSDDPAALGHCQIVYVGHEVSATRHASLAPLLELPVLTVSNAPGFLNEGGIVRFYVGDHVELSVNLDQARKASLSIQTKVLEVSRAVIENGKIREMR